MPATAPRPWAPIPSIRAPTARAAMVVARSPGRASAVHGRAPARSATSTSSASHRGSGSNGRSCGSPGRTWTRWSGADQSAATSAAHPTASRAESEASTATTTGRGSVLRCMVLSGSSLLWSQPRPGAVAPTEAQDTGARAERPSAPGATQLRGEHRGFGAAGDAELVQQGGDVVLHRLLGQVHVRPDLAVGAAIGDVVKDAPLLRAEGGVAGIVGYPAPAHPLQHGRGRGRVEQRAARGHRADRADQV